MNKTKTAFMAIGAGTALLVVLSSSAKVVLFAQDKPAIDQQVGPTPFEQAQNLKTTPPHKDVALSPPVLTGGEKFHYYLKSTFGPTSFMLSATQAGLSQATDHVPEWGQGMEGYGRRYASAFGQKIVKRSLQLSMESALHEDPRYHPSGQDGTWQRTKWAVGQTFVAHKDSGGTRFAFSRFIAAYAAGFIATHGWQPANYHTVGDGLKAGSISIGLDTGMHVAKEFWPDIKAMMHRSP